MLPCYVYVKFMGKFIKHAARNSAKRVYSCLLENFELPINPQIFAKLKEMRKSKVEQDAFCGSFFQFLKRGRISCQ